MSFWLGAILGGGVGWLIGSERVIEVRKKNPVASDFKPGELVYYDSMRGLVPGKIVGTSIDGVKLKVTATRGAYPKGHEMTVTPRHVVKRSWVRQRGGQMKILEPRR